jgi:hypothetical protein
MMLLPSRNWKTTIPVMSSIGIRIGAIKELKIEHSKRLQENNDDDDTASVKLKGRITR